MNNTSIIESFTEIKSDKMINKTEIMSILESAFKAELSKKYKSVDNFDIIINPDNGDLQIWQNKIVVHDGEIENNNIEIELSDVLKIESDYEVGEEYPQELKINELGRRSISNLKQNLKSQIKNLENSFIVDKYNKNIGFMCSAEVHHIKRNVVILIDDDGIEIQLPKRNQIPKEFYKKGDIISFVIDTANVINNKPNIIATRISPEFLERLLEQEIPEIFDGLITIKKVVRMPGLKSKVAVDTYDDRVDPVGTCIGRGGSRINLITRELNGENIDIINYTENEHLYITRSLKPAFVKKIDISDNVAKVHVSGDDVGKAIGKGGSNIKLTSLITNFEIDIINDDKVEEEDIELIEFSDEVDMWVIEELKKVGIDTAKTFLSFDYDNLLSMTDLEEETIQKLTKVIKEEFDLK